MPAPSFDDLPRWEEGLGRLRDVVRQELVATQLAAHLPDPRHGPWVVDVGCGQGTQALRLARAGYAVTGIDPSHRLLDRAHRDRDAEPPHVAARLTLLSGSIDDLPALLERPADVLLCHGVVMYLPELRAPLATLAAVLAPNGVLSLLTRNRFGITMRAGMTAAWRDAVEHVDARRYANRIGVPDARADEPEEVLQACTSLGLEIERWYGVRLFTDHWPGDAQPPHDTELQELLEAERLAGERDPYRQVAALTHVVARRP